MRIVDFDGEIIDIDELMGKYDYYNGKHFGFKRCPFCKKGTKQYKKDYGGGDIKTVCLVCGKVWYYTGD